MEIPIKNLYFLLCYAWNRLEERDLVDVSTEDATSLLNLFARVLIEGGRYLIHRGLDRGYLAYEEDLAGVRGKIDFSGTLKRQLMANARLQCRFDELSHDVIHNRILKTTIVKLASHPDIETDYRADLADINRRLSNIQDIQLRSDLFARVQLHRNNAFYGFLMNVCEMIYNYFLVTQEEGTVKFRDFFRDDQLMPTLFEQFVCNFYRIELQGKHPGYHLKGAEYIDWDAWAHDSISAELLPKMKTDISIRTPSGYLIIDTKFYREALSHHHGKKVNSNNLYQLFSYVRNIESRGAEYRQCSGMLLYPTVDYELRLQYEIQGHSITINTVDLARGWQDIHSVLLGLVLGEQPRNSSFGRHEGGNHR